MISLKFYVLVFVIRFVCETEALDVGGKGVCVVRLSSMESKRQIYTVRVNKMCGRNKCVVKRAKVQHYTTWKNQPICCYGYQHNSDADNCEPICSTGCKDGRCIAPDVCHCEPPLRLDPRSVNRCIPHICDPPCFGSQCWGDNICKCFAGLDQYNATHCAHCEEGFILNSKLECVPKCDEVCVNSTCVAPNTCECLDGYRSKDKFTCEPVCDCVNAECVAPKTCSCLPGYKSVNATSCAPVCENCDNGLCTEPNNCACSDGYTKVESACKPACDKACVNGFCSAPNVCECNEGYVKNASNPEVCFKLCGGTCEGACDVDGVCQACKATLRPVT